MTFGLTPEVSIFFFDFILEVSLAALIYPLPNMITTTAQPKVRPLIYGPRRQIKLTEVSFLSRLYLFHNIVLERTVRICRLLIQPVRDLHFPSLCYLVSLSLLSNVRWSPVLEFKFVCVRAKLTQHKLCSLLSNLPLAPSELTTTTTTRAA